MSVLVDRPLWTFRGERWSHLISDQTPDELHRFANRVGLRRIGFQGDHYDLPERLLPRALDAGAELVDSRVLVRRLRAAGLRKPATYRGWHVIVDGRAGAPVDPARLHAGLHRLNGLQPFAGRDALADAIDELAPNSSRGWLLAAPGQVALAFDRPAEAQSPTPGCDRGVDIERWVTLDETTCRVDFLARAALGQAVFAL